MTEANDHDRLISLEEQNKFVGGAVKELSDLVRSEVISTLAQIRVSQTEVTTRLTERLGINETIHTQLFNALLETNKHADDFGISCRDIMKADDLRIHAVEILASDTDKDLKRWKNYIKIAWGLIVLIFGGLILEALKRWVW